MDQNIDWRFEHSFNTERQPTARLEAIGHCIYCNDNPPNLGEEHIWPDGLGGHLVLPQASCKRCEKLIDAFEQPVIRTNFGFARDAHGIHSKKRRPKRARATTFRAQKEGAPDIELPIGPNMPQIVMAETPGRRASIISGVEPDKGERLRHIGATNPNAPLPAHYGVQVDRYKTGNFPRFLAKVAHSYAVGLMPDIEFSPFLSDLILGKIDVSRSRFLGDVPRIRTASSLNVIRVGLSDGSFYFLPQVPPSAGRIVVVQIDLFTTLHLPTFEAVVGRVCLGRDAAEMIGTSIR